MSHRKPIDTAPPAAPAAPKSVDDLPEFVHISAISKRLHIGADVLVGMSHRKEFARVYLFGRRKFYKLDEVAEAIKTLVPGDPDQFHRVVRAIDAASPSQPTSGRRRRTLGVIR